MLGRSNKFQDLRKNIYIFLKSTALLNGYQALHHFIIFFANAIDSPR